MKIHRGTDDASLVAFYEATSARLVGLLTAMSGNRADAEELAQEAFVRLLGRWAAVSRYDDPEAWLRTVAIRLLISRQRRHKVARLRLPLLPWVQQPPEPSPDGVTLQDALLRLSPDQRAVVLLHHVLDLPLDEIAHELGLPVGTVKSRLSRGRAALKSLLGSEMTDHA